MTSTTSDCVSEGDEHRRGLQQTELGLMGHFPLGHESIELVQAEPGGKIEMDSGTSLCLSPAGGGGEGGLEDFGCVTIKLIRSPMSRPC